jgi:hypothetical protein
MSLYSLRPTKLVTHTNIDAFYHKYHFKLKKVLIYINGVSKICICVDSIKEEFKFNYELRSSKVLLSSEELNNMAIFKDFSIKRNHIEVDDVLYSFHFNENDTYDFNENDDKPYYAQHFFTTGELLDVVLDRHEVAKFTFVPMGLYKVLIQSDFKENLNRVASIPLFKSVRQEWDYERPCLHCEYIFLKSQTGVFRSKCCADGKFLRKPLPQELLYYCRFDNNDTFLRNAFIYNNLLSFGSLGVDKQYDSKYPKTQGGSVTLQGRTYLLHRRENDTKALVFYTHGLQYGSEQDRIMDDVQKVVGPYNMNGNKTDDCSVHIRYLNKLRHEQYYENNLAKQYASIVESMQHMTYEELKIDLTSTPISIYDISHYRSTERGDPCMHVILKHSKKSATVSAVDPYYETVMISH